VEKSLTYSQRLHNYLCVYYHLRTEIFDTSYGPFYRRQIGQLKLMYFVYNVDQIHQFWLTHLSLIKMIGESIIHFLSYICEMSCDR